MFETEVVLTLCDGGSSVDGGTAVKHWDGKGGRERDGFFFFSNVPNQSASGVGLFLGLMDLERLNTDHHYT